MNKPRINATEEYKSWRRLRAVPNLAQAIKNMLPDLLPPAPVRTEKRGIKAKALLALKAYAAKELFVDLLIEAVRNAKGKVVWFLPGYNACFTTVPEHLARRVVKEGHRPAELRRVVVSGVDFPNDLAVLLACEFIPLKTKDADAGWDRTIGVIYDELKRIGVPLDRYMENAMTRIPFEGGLEETVRGGEPFGDIVYESLAEYRHCWRSDAASKVQEVLSFSRLAKLLQRARRASL